MTGGSFDDIWGERKMVLGIVGVLFAGVCFSWLRVTFPDLITAAVPPEFTDQAASPAEIRDESPVMRRPEAAGININTADARVLEQLPGIGPVLARRIIDYRQEHGYFRDAAELTNVKGIGPKTWERIADQIVLE